ncbi:hypothetical protein MPSEU_000132800 [Mayamaea pseudoterrestris]|nr:hypothetical protein MPSEU_000132800 [Mayamaea pseudoterrestris]
MMQAVDSVEQQQQPVKQKRGFMSRLRLPRRKSRADKREGTPSPQPEADAGREPFVGSPMSNRPKQRKSRVPDVREVKLDQAPTAREAAFGGPPRYDWIDIETAAAIKVQSAFRRNKTLRDLEKDGVSTAAIRNAQRRRKAQQKGLHAGTADIPSIFQCCGVGLAFGDATEEDYETSRQHEKEQYEERKKAREQREAQLRQNYIKTQREKQTSIEEIIEVVDEAEKSQAESV